MIEVNNAFENIEKLFSLGPEAEVSCWKIQFPQFQTHLHTSASRRLMINLDAFAGDFYDGNRFTVGIRANLEYWIVTAAKPGI